MPDEATMPCAEVEGLLVALLDGELAEAERGLVEAHLAACPVCAELRDELASVGHAASAWPVAGAPVLDRVRAALAGDEGATLDAIDALRREVLALRAEVADLRHELLRQPPLPASLPVLFPTTPAASVDPLTLS